MHIISIISVSVSLLFAVWGFVQKIRNKNISGAYGKLDDILRVLVSAIEVSGRKDKTLIKLKKIIKELSDKMEVSSELDEYVKKAQDMVDSYERSNPEDDIKERALKAVKGVPPFAVK